MVYEVDWNDPALERWLDSITKKTTHPDDREKEMVQLKPSSFVVFQ